MAQIYLADITIYDPAISGTRVLRFATQGYTTGPSDSPANTHYAPRIQQPANMQRSLASGGRTRGESQVGYGELVLVNVDGGLDSLVDCGFDARPIEIRLGSVRPNRAPTWVTVLKGTMAGADFDWQRVTIRLRDRQAELQKPLQTTLYAGTNSLPNGLEGLAGDLKGKQKPRLYGQAFNIAPPLCNTSKLIYQISDRAIASVDAVYDRGAALTAGAAYADQTDMLSNAPAAGQYRAWLAGGFVRLGSSPSGQVTVDATAGANAAARTAAQIAKQIMVDAGISAGDVSASDVSALDAANSATIGYWLSDDTTATAVLDAVTGSVGAWWGVDRLGVFRMARLNAPSGSPVATLTTIEGLKVDRIASSDVPIPAWQVSLAYKPIGTVQSSDLAASVTDSRRAELRERFRTLVANDAAVLVAHPLSETLSVETALVDVSAAQAECDRLLSLYKVRRDTLSVRAALSESLAAALDLGAVVAVVLPRFGYASGRLMCITSIRTDLRGGMVDLTLWG